MRRVRFLFPTLWDERQLAACRHRWEGSFEVGFLGPPSEDVPWDFDVVGFIDETAGSLPGTVDGVLSSSDYPGATAAGAVALAAGLPGSSPAAVLGCSHKYYSRLRQREAVPTATPGFAVVDSAALDRLPPELRFPCFVKPVKGAFSVLSRRVDSAAELVAFLSREAVREFTGEYMRVFDRLLERYTDFEVGGRFFLAEELLAGPQVTVEGYCYRGEVEILGVVESLIERHSFVGFLYPATLPAPVQERMATVARRLMAATGLDCTLFNIEMTWDPVIDRIAIIEVNPRVCGQFADLWQKVDGASSYEVALALAVGERPTWRHGGGRYPVAASIPLRTFEPARVARAPGAEEVAAAEALFPGTQVWLECSTGDELADFDRYEDGFSYRYGVINVGAPDREALPERVEAVRRRLGIELVPLR